MVLYRKLLFCVHSLHEASRKGEYLCQINVLQRNPLGRLWEKRNLTSVNT